MRMVQGEGYLQVQADGRVLILVDEAGDPADIDAGEWEERLRRAEAFLKVLREGGSS